MAQNGAYIGDLTSQLNYLQGRIDQQMSKIDADDVIDEDDRQPAPRVKK